jgi:O-antigen/teichoic acid export membrane protein
MSPKKDFNPPSIEKATPSKKEGPTLGQRTLHGFGWILIGSIIAKFVNLAGQLVLAWLLLPQDFGLIGLAYTVSTFANIVGQSGVRVVLVQRHRQMRRWATAAFWMSLVIGLIQSLTMVAAAPFAATFFQEPQVAGLLVVLALAAPFQAVRAIPAAKLQSDLRFKIMATGTAAATVGTMVLTILFAALGLGAYSFALPYPIVAVVSLGLNWVISRPPVQMRLHLRRWPYLFGDNLKLLAANFLLTFTAQGDYIILGALYPASVVGIYYFAFRLSVQSMMLVTSNLGAVLFPALSRIPDPRAQTRAFLRGARLLAAVGLPLALLQAAVAEPAIRLMFNDKWSEAIPLIQVLSLAMAFRLVGSPAGHLIQAQGRFGLMGVLYAVYACIFLAVVFLAAIWGNVLAVAVSASFYFAIVVGVFHPWIVTRGHGGSVKEILRLYAVPSIAALASIGGASLAATALPSMIGRDIARIAIIISAGVPTYLFLLAYLDPPIIADLYNRWSGIIKSARPHEDHTD